MNTELFSEINPALFEQIDWLGRTLIAPHAASWDAQELFPHQQVQQLAAHGLLGICIDREWGGLGYDLTNMALIIQGIARFDAGMALTLAAHSLVCDHIRLFGNEDQQRRYLPDLAAGKILGAWALAEPHSGSDAASITTEACPLDNGWQINGHKMFVTQGNVAGVYVVMARSAEGKNISAFLVDRHTDGVRPAPALKKMGCRSSNTSPVHFDHVQVAEQQQLGTLHRALQESLTLLDRGRIAIAALATGITRACVEDAVAYARRRQQFGKSISSFQGVQWPLAEMATQLDASWLLTLQAASRCDRGLDCGTAAAKAKLFASRCAVESADRAVQVHGGYGCLKNLSIERYYRDAKLCEIGEGTSEIQRLIIARDLFRA